MGDSSLVAETGRPSCGIKTENNKEHLMDDFIGGTIFQAYLNPWTYHRWHSPVSGIIEDVYPIEGYYFVKNPSIIGTDNDYVNSQPFLCCTSTRLVFVIKADNEKIGRVILIMIGMTEVSTCKTERKRGDYVRKGE